MARSNPRRALPRGCARTPAIGRSSGSGFVLRNGLPVHPYRVPSGVLLLRHPLQRRGRPGIAPGSLLAPTPASESVTNAYVLKQLPAVTNNSGRPKFQPRGTEVNTCFLTQVTNQCIFPDRYQARPDTGVTLARRCHGERSCRPECATRRGPSRRAHDGRDRAPRGPRRQPHGARPSPQGAAASPHCS